MYSAFYKANVRMQLGWEETRALLTCTSTCVARNETGIFCSQFYAMCCWMVSLLSIFELTENLVGNMTKKKKYTPCLQRSPLQVFATSALCVWQQCWIPWQPVQEAAVPPAPLFHDSHSYSGWNHHRKRVMEFSLRFKSRENNKNKKKSESRKDGLCSMENNLWHQK